MRLFHIYVYQIYGVRNFTDPVFGYTTYKCLCNVLKKCNCFRYHLIRHAWDIKIQDSILVDLLCQYSKTVRKLLEITFALRLLNLNKPYNPCKTELSILNIALISKKWKLVDAISSKTNVTLHSEEYEYLVLKAKRNFDDNEFSEQSISDEDVNSDYPKLAYIDFVKRCDKFIVNIFKENEVRESISMKTDGHFLIRWQGRILDGEVERLVYGQSNVPIQPFDYVCEDEEPFPSYTTRSNIDLTKSVNLGELANKNANVHISCVAVHSSLVKHNFQKQKLCILNVKLHIHNISDSTIVVIVKTLETERQVLKQHNLPSQFIENYYRDNDIASPMPIVFTPHPSKDFNWVRAGRIVRNIEPLAKEIIDLSAAILRPGCYEVGACLSITSYKLNQLNDAVQQESHIESSFIVENDS